jgi:hypothetical protein
MSCEYAALTDEERRLMDAIEADLDRMMAIEPSADFAARVRERIGAVEHDGRWSMPWTLAAAAVLVVAAGVLLATVRDRSAGLERPAMVAGHDVRLPAPDITQAAHASSGSRIPRLRASTTQRASPFAAGGSRRGHQITRADEPEVLVPQDLRLAIDRVMAMVRAGTLDEQAFPAERAAGMESPGATAQRSAAAAEESAVPAPMVVEELQVLPIERAGASVEKGFGSD